MSTLLGNPDYSDEFEDKPLPLNLYGEYDDERDLWIKPRLESLVNGTFAPSQLAIDVDTRITEDTNRKHDELMERPDPPQPDRGRRRRRRGPHSASSQIPYFSIVIGHCTALYGPSSLSPGTDSYR